MPKWYGLQGLIIIIIMRSTPGSVSAGQPVRPAVAECATLSLHRTAVAQLVPAPVSISMQAVVANNRVASVGQVLLEQLCTTSAGAEVGLLCRQHATFFDCRFLTYGCT
jgi:hypothetical protein